MSTLRKNRQELLLGFLLDLKGHDFDRLMGVGGVSYRTRRVELRKQGYQIDSQPLPTGGRRYRLLSPTPVTAQKP